MKKNKSISQKIKEISKKNGISMAPPDHPVYKSGPIIIFINKYIKKEVENG
tara:strand:+ start:255 stop:407 length:153 start_codon:yes stop_codon:yes gene_type:complete